MRPSGGGVERKKQEGGRHPSNRRIPAIRVHPYLTFLMFACVALLGGCKGSGALYGSGGGTPLTAPVVLMLTDAPPANVSIISAELTLTGATLNPGNISLLTTPTPIELIRLQTDTAYLSTTNVNPGNYTSLVLTFANPSITFENDTGSVIVAGVGNTTCAIGAICTIQPVTTNLSTTIPLTSFTLSAATAAGLLVDVNLDDLLSNNFAEDFIAGTSASEFTPAGNNAPPVGAEDFVGQIVSVNAASNTLTLQNALQQVTLTANNATSYFQYPSNICTVMGFACVQSGQTLSVDIGIQADGSVVARNVLFEDANTTDTEVEGIVTAINAGAQTFNIVVLGESAPISGLNIGAVATVHYMPQTPLDVDFAHADNLAVDTTGFLFSTPNQDLVAGQEVQIQRNPASSPATSITADRVRLRSSRVPGTIQMIASPNMQLGGSSPPFPSLFSAHGIPQIKAQSSTPTIYTGTTIDGVKITNMTQLGVTNTITVRGPLFNLSGSRTQVATKVVLEHQN